MIRRIALFALLAAALARPSSAQGELAAAFASQVRTDVGVLASQPALATWQKSHAGNLELAHYETYKDPYQEDFRRLDRWCAASVGQSPAEVVRAALFYVPSVVNGALPPLPEKEDATLTRACRMQAIWYQTPAPAAMDAVVRELSSAWGQPNGQSAEPDIGGSGTLEARCGVASGGHERLGGRRPQRTARRHRRAAVDRLCEKRQPARSGLWPPVAR